MLPSAALPTLPPWWAWACALCCWARRLNAALQPLLFATALTFSLSLVFAVIALNLAGLRAHHRCRARSHRVRNWRAGLGPPLDASPDELCTEDDSIKEAYEAYEAYEAHEAHEAHQAHKSHKGSAFDARPISGSAARACIRRASARMLDALDRAGYVLDPQHPHTVVVEHPVPLEGDPEARALQLNGICKVAAQLARDAEEDRKGAGGRPRDPADVFGGLDEGRVVVAVCVVRWDGAAFLSTGVITGALYRGSQEQAPGVVVCVQADALPEEALSGALFTAS